ncbi:Sec-independent protein translocase subunit TatA/TatB [Mucilaginibacter aquatilis]|uniref:Sec-independent protein translocase protein TatA n=1 Tax=Mucilaginibacter aquatilis TaxID=1517760 RepID=A0A6I4IR79_9SPHI|nr:twin-arginine translocase TatA/TatE family subunit [Mucilaginibacter aquatilis]MVN92384.1 twin-arginine translocase TatA/TatE family subunit [Mucilaginibacter aquatilis]
MYSPVLLELFNIGGPEFILILFVALLLFGGNKLPELARGLGKGIRDFKDASEGVKREIHNQINSFDEKPSEPEYRNNYNTDTETDTHNSTAVSEEHEKAETSVKKEY